MDAMKNETLKKAYQFAKNELKLENDYPFFVCQGLKSNEGEKINGKFLIDDKEILIEKELSIGNQILVLFHELAHALDHEKNLFKTSDDYWNSPDENFANDMQKSLYIKWKIRGN